MSKLLTSFLQKKVSFNESSASFGKTISLPREKDFSKQGGKMGNGVV
jgi:hypothetical protein